MKVIESNRSRDRSESTLPSIFYLLIFNAFSKKPKFVQRRKLNQKKHCFQQKDLSWLAKFLIYFIVCCGEGTMALQKLRTWRGPNSLFLGSSPAARMLPGIEAVADQIFVFGGVDVSGHVNALI